MIPAACAVDGAYFGIHIMESFISFYYYFGIYFSFVRGRSKNGRSEEEMKARRSFLLRRLLLRSYVRWGEVVPQYAWRQPLRR
ncbi:hypothetical protein CD006_00525 [Enterobacter sp. 10-1]|nr:hypothetical protein CD006_00525 [Enterobacter sp. 10-1]